MICARESQIEPRPQSLGERAIRQVLAEPALALQHVVHAEAPEEREHVGHQQDPRLDQLVVDQVREAHRKRRDRKQIKQAVRAPLIIDGERICLAILCVDVLERARTGQRQRRG